MTTTATPSPRTDADYLATLPPPIQAELVSLVRRVAGTSENEKAFVLQALTAVAETQFRSAVFQEQMVLVELLSALAQVVAEVHRTGA